ncbi:hypothetical protein D3C72_795880 [compost metagenome]
MLICSFMARLTRSGRAPASTRSAAVRKTSALDLSVMKPPRVSKSNPPKRQVAVGASKPTPSSRASRATIRLVAAAAVSW